MDVFAQNRRNEDVDDPKKILNGGLRSKFRLTARKLWPIYEIMLTKRDFQDMWIFWPIWWLGRKSDILAHNQKTRFKWFCRVQGGSSREQHHRMRLEKWSSMMGVRAHSMRTTRRYEQIKIWRRRFAPLPINPLIHQSINPWTYQSINRLIH